MLHACVAVAVNKLWKYFRPKKHGKWIDSAINNDMKNSLSITQDL
jgi:hypothetical protein